jgi:hypothetical protein
MNNKKLKDVSKRIKNCYIERLIYEQMYLKNIKFKLNTSSEYTQPIQDEAHTNWLKQTSEDFNTCYPDISIKVNLKYFKLTIPNYLMIRYYHKGKLVFVEEYYKVNDITYKVFRNKSTTYKVSNNFRRIIKLKKENEDNTLLFKLIESI